MFKFLFKVGKQILGTNSKKIAEGLAKQGGKRIPKSKVPANATVKKAPSVAQPRSPSTGRMQTNSNPPAAAKSTAPKVVRNKPTKPAAPKRGDNAPAVRTSTNKPSVSSTSPKRGSSGASYSRVKSNPPKAKNDSKIVGISPKGKAVLAAPALAGSLPEVGTESRPTKKVEKKVSTGGPKTRPNNKPKKKTEKKTTPAPKGPMTLTKYLNDEIKKRGSSVTAEKKGSDKYTSISAAKKAGSLYYKNTKTGKTMAAVYKEDLKK